VWKLLPKRYGVFQGKLMILNNGFDSYTAQAIFLIDLPLVRYDETNFRRVIMPVASAKKSTNDCQPFLRWAGSKRKLISELRRYWPLDGSRYVEPFAGSACLFFALDPSSALLGDINEDLVRTYLEVKHRPERLAEALLPLRRSKRTYLKLREIDAETLDATSRAARFVYLNRYCFNGLYRTNQAGKFNVPYGATGTGSLPSKEHLLRCSRALKRARLRRCDFDRLLSDVGAGDFVYLDPPFSVSERRVFNEYQAEVFSSKDVRRLRQTVERLDRSGARFLLSYADCEEAGYLQKGFLVRRVSVRRNIAGFVGKRTISDEVLISNFEPRSETCPGKEAT
jgi:DNA adenine methylase